MTFFPFCTKTYFNKLSSSVLQRISTDESLELSFASGTLNSNEKKTQGTSK